MDQEISNRKTSINLNTEIKSNRICQLKFVLGMQKDPVSKVLSNVADIGSHRTFGREHRTIARTYNLGGLHFVTATFDAMSFKRTKKHLKTLSTDHWILLHIQSGDLRFQSTHAEFTLTSGSLMLLSLTDEFSIDFSRCKCSMLWLSRDAFFDMAHILDQASPNPVSGTLSNVLVQFIIALKHHMPNVSEHEIPLITKSLTTLLDASLASLQKPHRDKITPNLVTVAERARLYIHQNIGSPELSPDQICKVLGISRRTLSYIFETKGGVANYIRRKRLIASHLALSNSVDHRLVSTIAYEYGYTNSAQFTRNFTAFFGYSPKEARDKPGAVFREVEKKPRNFEEWLGF